MTYSASTNTFWVLTRSENERMLLSKIDAASGEKSTSDLGTATGYRNPGLVIDEQQRVWAAWGNNLVMYEPALRTKSEYALPTPPKQVVNTETARLSGPVVLAAVADEEGVWVARFGVPAVFRFNFSTRTWEDRALKYVVPVPLTSMAILSDGALVVSGSAGNTVASELLPVIGGSQLLGELDSLNWIALPNDSFVFVDSQTGFLQQYDRLTNKVSAKGTHKFRIPVDVPITVSADGSLWTWEHSDDGLLIDKIDAATGQVQQFRYPLTPQDTTIRGNLGYQGPRRIVPSLRVVVADNAGTAWVFSQHGQSSDGRVDAFPSIYKLKL